MNFSKSEFYDSNCLMTFDFQNKEIYELFKNLRFKVVNDIKPIIFFLRKVLSESILCDFYSFHNFGQLYEFHSYQLDERRSLIVCLDCDVEENVVEIEVNKKMLKKSYFTFSVYVHWAIASKELYKINLPRKEINKILKWQTNQFELKFKQNENPIIAFGKICDLLENELVKIAFYAE